MRPSLVSLAAACCCGALPVLAQTLPDAALPASEAWSVHGQATYVGQKKPAMAAPYSGPNSLSGEAETSYSFTATAFLGLRLGPATELYLNPEASQGVPLSGLLGLAGFTNGELAKTSGAELTPYRARLFVRHTVDLGGDSAPVEAGANQLGGSQAAQRLVLTLGTVSVLDVFDGNAYAHDPRLQFMNWALMTYAAYDYAADARGYTTGASAEYVGDGWKLRLGRYAVPQQPNQLMLDGRLMRHHGDQLEVERDYEWSGQHGTVHALVYRNQAVMATYADALALAARDGTPPSLDSVRRSLNAKRGVGLAVEQDLRGMAGLFLRAMRSDGHTETECFTEADRSLSAGLTLPGTHWQRAQDSVGLALARSDLSRGHQDYLARGGLGVFLGDGRLTYRPEDVLEAYYNVEVGQGVHVSLDWQHLRNPGYNADRGPTHVAALRMHWEL